MTSALEPLEDSNAELRAYAADGLERERRFEDHALGEALVERGWLDSARLARILEEKGDEPLSEFVLRTRLVPAVDLRRALRDALGESTWGDRPAGDPLAESGQSTLISPPAEAGLERYRVLRPLARGGMGCVYEAQAHDTSERVALKTLDPNQALSRGGLLRFVREVEITRRLAHPAIVGVRDHGLGRRPFLALELLRGGSLAGRVKAQGPLPAREALRVAVRLCEALEYLHERRILHRDLKPKNVLFDERDRPRLIDFSLAVDLDEGGERLTQEGTILGTPGYMAPEQARGEPLDERADVYGLGAVLYFALTGEAPQPERERRGLAGAFAPPRPQAPGSFAPGIPPELERVCLRALSYRAGQRYPSVRALRRALEASAVAARTVRLRRAVLGIVALNVVLALLIALPARPTLPAPGAARLDLALHDGPPVTLVHPDGRRELIGGERLRVDVPPGSTLRLEPGRPLTPSDWAREGQVVFNPIDRGQFVEVRPAQGAGFLMGRHEVTWGQFRGYARAAGASLPDPVLPGGARAADAEPVFNVTWDEAQAYARWAGCRLPTDAEWERAYGGPDPARPANLAGEDAFPLLAPAGSFPAACSVAGCLDMEGNVWEWTADAEPGSRARVIRGGGWTDVHRGGRAALDPGQRGSWLGFRLAR